MAHIKATDISSIHKLFQERGSATEKLFLEQLSPDLLELYRAAVPGAWVAVERQNALYEKAMKVLFPVDNVPGRSLGRAMAHHSYGSIYKLFLQIPTIQFIIRQAARIWKTYFDKGQAAVENEGPNNCDFIVRDFPELPHTIRETVAGHIIALLEMVKRHNIQVYHLDADPSRWVWRITWK